MKTLKYPLSFFASALFAFGAISQAGATIYTINDGGLETTDIKIDGISYNGALAGGILVTPTAMPSASFVTVCTDVEGTLYLGQSYSYSAPVDFLNSTSPNGVKPYWGNDNAAGLVDPASAAYAIQNAATLFYGNYSTLQTGTTSQKAGIQLAIWDVLYNTTSSGAITGTRFSFSADGDPTAISGANQLITDLATAPAQLKDFAGQILVPDPLDQHNADGEPPQELLYFVPPGTSLTTTPVPEASTMIAGALMLLPFGAAGISRLIRKARTH